MKNYDLSVATLVIGIIGLILSFIPILNFFGIFFCVIGFIIGFKLKLKNSKSKTIIKGDSLVTSGIVLCIMGLIVFIIVTTIMGIFAASL
ncbi:hypothetical protein SAMN02745134_02836 [Clostridium acidisoli DSM 12555]|uniref:DUF4190 domain-containing protein n=1 Tax=Clostridium acidisoli DSM 12555 TaxID=1121291 RepID=A0A1W1XR29_9CLOT|nr:hypothetical protein SAMN02745134_02836 [Clostridium acidisoli DSM 12555]